MAFRSSNLKAAGLCLRLRRCIATLGLIGIALAVMWSPPELARAQVRQPLAASSNVRALAQARLSLAQPGSDGDGPSLGTEVPALVREPEECGAELQGYMRVSGTIYNSKRPERSMAIVTLGSSSHAAVYHGGASIAGVHLLEIEPRGVLISIEHGEVCWLRLMRVKALPRPSSRPRAAPRSVQSPSRRTVFSDAELTKGIREIRPDAYGVDRALLMRAIAQAPALARTTRGQVILQNGSAYGMALRQIASGGLLSHLGLKRGDILKTINGISVASVDGMLSARTQLASAPRLSVSLIRGGRPMTLEYQVN